MVKDIFIFFKFEKHKVVNNENKKINNIDVVIFCKH